MGVWATIVQDSQLFLRVVSHPFLDEIFANLFAFEIGSLFFLDVVC